MSEVTLQEMSPLVQSFISSMTPEKLKMLRTGCPDDSTKILLAEMLLEIISAVSKLVLAGMKGKRTAVQDVKPTSCHLLPVLIAEALDVQKPVWAYCESTESLISMMHEEIAENVNLSLSRKSSRAALMSTRIMPHSKLNTMVTHACKMLRNIIKLCATPLIRCKKQPRTESAATALDDSWHKQVTARADTCQPPLSAINLDSLQVIVSNESQRRMRDSPSTSGETAKSTKLEVLEQEVRVLTESLLDDLTSTEVKWLQSKSCPEMEVLANFAEEILNSSVSGDSRPKQTPPPTMKKKVKNFFNKHIAKVMLLRTAAKLRNKFTGDLDASGIKSVKSLASAVESLLQADGEQQNGNQDLVIETLKNVSSDSDLSQAFEQQCTELLYQKLTEEQRRGSSSGRSSCSVKSLSVRPSRTSMCACIQDQVRMYLTITAWWLNTQAGGQSKRVSLILMDSETKRLRKQQEAEKKRDLNKAALWMLLGKLVTRLLKGAKITAAAMEPKKLIDYLFDCVWPLVEGTNVAAKTNEKTDKVLFKRVCKLCGGPDKALLRLLVNDDRVPVFIATTLGELWAEKEQSRFSRFLSAVGEVITRPFRSHVWRGGTPEHFSSSIHESYSSGM